MISTQLSLLKVCETSWDILLSHHTQWQNYKTCLKVLLWTAGEQPQDRYIAHGPPDWELCESALKSVQPHHSHTHIFPTTYPHKPRVGYLWSVGLLFFLHMFISSVRIVVSLSGIFERRWIHQSLKTCVTENWMKWGQMFIKDANMMLESFVVIRSIRTCKFCSTGKF